MSLYKMYQDKQGSDYKSYKDWSKEVYDHCYSLIQCGNKLPFIIKTKLKVSSFDQVKFEMGICVDYGVDCLVDNDCVVVTKFTKPKPILVESLYMLTTDKYIEQLEQQNRTLAVQLCYEKGCGDVKEGFNLYVEKYKERPFDGAWQDIKTIIDVMTKNGYY